MLSRDDPKSKEDGSSSVGGDDTAMVILSGDEANPSRIEKSVSPGTDEKEKEVVDEGEQEMETVDEENKDREEEKEPKEVEEEMEPQRDDETAIIVRPHGTESHAESILQKGSTQVFFEEQFRIDCEARKTKLKGPTDTIGGPSNNVQSGKAHSDSVEDTGPKALKAMDGRLMKAVEDAVKDLKKTVSSLFDKLTLLEDEVKSLRSNGDNPSEENKESDEEDDVDKVSEEEDGGDKESKESEEEDDGAEEEEPEEDEAAEEDVAEEEAAWKKNRGAKKAAEKEAAKKAAAEKVAAKKAAAEKAAAKKAAQKKPPLKPKKSKTKKVGKKTE
ncbi:unnamed protein product [Eruca vesicaria subsp. sativa]|uniref:Uncharacterized protein n=1 Tax=Eruca vesicaria subsp. sativa TaxID=29727 RepID=A0ABC8LHQ5_ERUVS|nr:unnamed protein product [Eruca vesicaria subsp. sativa]